MSQTLDIPLSLYIHYPYCVHKCPYCDFNSFARQGPDTQYDARYFEMLQREFELCKPYVQGRSFISIFLGGGTPSHASLQLVARILRFFEPWTCPGAEITLEANPGTVHVRKFQAYRDCGINRLSLGVQSFTDSLLRRLGRIHDRHAALQAVAGARQAGFDNINLDLMYGLPGQQLAEALADVRQAVDLGPEHISWYELSVEPDTEFGRHPPLLPGEEVLESIEQAGLEQLQVSGYQHYEVSNYCQPGRCCVHNVNYWCYGDYIGLGAGAHSKLSSGGQILRRAAPKDPQIYLSEGADMAFTAVPPEQLPGEYMLNRLRLFGPIERREFTARTFLAFSVVAERLQQAADWGLLCLDRYRYALTDAGRRHLNAVLRLFV